MKTIITILIISLFSIAFSQTMSEADIKELAEQVNDKIRGLDIGNGGTVRGCFAFGRTIVYQYDVNEHWIPPENIKDVIIENAIEAGNAAVFFQNDINVNCYYYNGNTLLKKVSIKSKEFSNLNFDLGDYLSIKGHPKAKGVDLKIKPPVDWKIKEVGRPNIVKEFVYGTNTYMILIKDNITFFSKNEFREIFNDTVYVKKFIISESPSLHNIKILDQDIISIDRYPFLVYTVKGELEYSGIKTNIILKNWITYYEDKIIYFSGGGLDNMESQYLMSLYERITNSVIFPEQYNW